MCNPVCPAQLSGLGVTEDCCYRTANSQHFDDLEWKKWVSQRTFVALYITAHRGHLDAVQYLLEHGNSDRQESVFKSRRSVACQGTEWLVLLVPATKASWTRDLPAPNHSPRQAARSHLRCLGVHASEAASLPSARSQEVLSVWGERQGTKMPEQPAQLHRTHCWGIPKPSYFCPT